MTAVFYELEADRVEVDAVEARQPWDAGRVRLTLWHRDDNGNFTDQVFDLSGESARDLASCLATVADEVAPAPVAVDDEPPLAYREGDRIRRADGQGYVDHVPDDVIRHHAAEAGKRGEVDNTVFALATLELRARERKALASLNLVVRRSDLP